MVELLVVMAIIAILAAMVVPRYLDRVDSAKETVLRNNLRELRTVIDQFYRDKSRYPESLQELVTLRYLRAVPFDPITERNDSWVVLPPKEDVKAVFDIHSGATGRARDGSSYGQW